MKYTISNKRNLMRKWYHHAKEDCKLSKVSMYAHRNEAKKCFSIIRDEIDNILLSLYENALDN